MGEMAGVENFSVKSYFSALISALDTASVSFVKSEEEEVVPHKQLLTD